jgi:hypothetical protein
MLSRKNIWIGIAVILSGILSISCGPSPEEQSATAAALTAAAATSTPTITPTPTATPAPTQTPTPTPSPTSAAPDNPVQVDLFRLIPPRFLSAENESNELFLRAIKELEQNNTRQAYDLISEAIKTEPNKAIYYVVRANAAARMEGYMEKHFNDLNKAEQLDPHLADIYLLRSTLAQVTGNTEQFYFNLHKTNLFYQLEQRNVSFPQEVFGITELEFLSKDGKIGYIQTGLSLDFIEILPLPKIGAKAYIVFNKLEIVDIFGTVILSNNLPINKDGYEITAYNLLTTFQDSSGQFYQLYYQVRYRDD